jgi:hypothetical protein
VMTCLASIFRAANETCLYFLSAYVEQHQALHGGDFVQYLH